MRLSETNTMTRHGVGEKISDSRDPCLAVSLVWGMFENYMDAAYVVCASTPSLYLWEMSDMEYNKAGNEGRLVET